ncbi:hypothetical protein ACI65C_000187 [Semiaphis heraclei]
MPNYCCVREIHTISKTIFKVPQNEDMKKKWEEALGFTIKKSYHICAILLEVCFIKHAASLNPFEDTYEEFFQTNVNKLTFPCGVHKTDMLTDIFVSYITMRMRQFSYLKNQDVKKVNKSSLNKRTKAIYKRLEVSCKTDDDNIDDLESGSDDFDFNTSVNYDYDMNDQTNNKQTSTISKGEDVIKKKMSITIKIVV